MWGGRCVCVWEVGIHLLRNVANVHSLKYKISITNVPDSELEDTIRLFLDCLLTFCFLTLLAGTTLTDVSATGREIQRLNIN